MTTKQTTNYLEARLEANPDSLAFSRLADCYLSSGEIDRAIEICSRGVKLHPHNNTGHLVLGRCLMKQSRFEEAIAAFTEVCRLDPRNSIAIKLLGDLFSRKGAPVQAMARAGDLYRLVARLDPFDTSMATIAARVIGLGITDLFDILADGAGSATSTVSMNEPIVDGMGTGPDILETVEASIDEAVDSTAEETFDTVEISESDEIISNSSEEIMLLQDLEGSLFQSTNDRSDSVSENNAPEEFLIESEGGETGLPVDASANEEGPGNPAAPATMTLSEIPDGQEISSRLDTLFGNVSEAAALQAPELPSGELSEEHEELFLDAQDELIVEEGVDIKKQLSDALSLGQDSGTEQLFLDDSPLPAATIKNEDIAEAGADTEAGWSEIATPTLAEIYFKQGQLQRALSIYRRLLEKEPGSDHLKQRIEAVNAAIASGGEGMNTREQERGGASRKINEETAPSPAAADLRIALPARETKPKEKAKFKWVKRPDGRQ